MPRNDCGHWWHSICLVRKLVGAKLWFTLLAIAKAILPEVDSQGKEADNKVTLSSRLLRTEKPDKRVRYFS